MNPRAHKRFLWGALLVLALVAPEGIATIASGLRGPYGARPTAPTGSQSVAPGDARRSAASARLAEVDGPLAAEERSQGVVALAPEILRPGM